MYINKYSYVRKDTLLITLYQLSNNPKQVRFRIVSTEAKATTS